MKRTIITCAAILATMLPSAAFAATANAPSDGLVGLWLFANGASTVATIGNDLDIGLYDSGSGNEFGGASTQIGTEADPFLYQDSGNIQETTWDAVDVTHGIGGNGGGTMVNEYTWLMDYKQDTGGIWSSLYDTALGNPHTAPSNDGDLFVKPDGTVGTGDTGYSVVPNTYDPSETHRIVLSVDNGTSFRMYVDGVLLLDGLPQAVDGRFALHPVVHLLVDNQWEGSWGFLNTAMMWDRALTSAEVVGMGTFTDASNSGFPTPLIIGELVPEPSTMILFGLGLSSLVAVRRKK